MLLCVVMYVVAILCLCVVVLKVMGLFYVGEW